MNINIAFNTIIYVMVFLFPGVLFRRIFFSGKFNKTYESGNVFERIMYYLLLSLVSITLFCIFYYYFREITGDIIPVFNHIKADEIIHSFISIYKNEFPSLLKHTESLFQLVNLLLSLYLFSSILGFITKKIIFIFGFEKRWSLFPFLNKWDYLMYSTRANNNRHKIGDAYTSKIDITTENNCFISGRLHEIVFSKEGNVEAYALHDTYKLYYLDKQSAADQAKIEEVKSFIAENNPFYMEYGETGNKYEYLKRVRGNLFTIASNKVLNTSLSFIKVSGIYETIKTISRTAFTILFILSLVFSLSYLFWDYNIFLFSSYFKRVAFCITFPLSVVCFLLLLMNGIDYKKTRKKYWNDLKTCFFLVLRLIAPYYYIFNSLPFLGFLIIQFALLLIYANWNGKIRK